VVKIVNQKLLCIKITRTTVTTRQVSVAVEPAILEPNFFLNSNHY